MADTDKCFSLLRKRRKSANLEIEGRAQNGQSQSTNDENRTSDREPTAEQPHARTLGDVQIARQSPCMNMKHLEVLVEIMKVGLPE